ncbi:flagellar export protein FliJ [Caldalkalibacillus salinus]|uniref:flagellar export protein FliJ n=1 Tax=Caldalkalibacillus salinus TaxID=2803787 RepID=UPI001923A9B5|nr:flagellar export protein FliJ [Caldalkalibacillus salinus]
MATFHYPYQRIIEVKEKEKEQAQLQVARAQQKQSRLEKKLHEIEEKIAGINQKMSKNKQGTILIQQLKEMEAYRQNLKKKLASEKVHYASVKKNVDKKQEVLIEKLKEEKMWMHLKEKYKENVVTEQKRKEQLALDELARNSFRRLEGTRGEEVERE